tara:strand:- start:149 stop:1006 length:858 start_codon:yes stop_codon:yes gene_type:complete
MRFFYFLIILSFTLTSCASKTYYLSKQLNEISGIDNAFFGVYFSINDSGDDSFVYLIKDDGSVLHKMFVSGAENIDWEDLSSDGDFLYIGDIGNNQNQRKDLMVYRVPINISWMFYSIHRKLNHNLPDTVKAELYALNYPDQMMFPPEDSQMNFDSEALTYADGKLLILSKDRSKPYKGICKIYEADLSNNLLEVKLLQEIQLKGVSWLTGSVTGCDYFNNKLYVLTYKRLYVFERRKNQFELVRQKNLGTLQQWEGICVDSEKQIRIVAEKSRLGKQKMKIIKL